MVTFGQKQAVKPGPFRLDAFVEQLLTELCRRLSGGLGLVVRPAVGVGHVADSHVLSCRVLAISHPQIGAEVCRRKESESGRIGETEIWNRANRRTGDRRSLL